MQPRPSIYRNHFPCIFGRIFKRVPSIFSSDSMKGTVRSSANYVPLTPISFLERSAVVYRDRTSFIDGHVKYTWKQTFERCKKLASALTDSLGISRGEIVATMAPNTVAMYELHFAVPMAGAILCTLNIRLDSAMMAVLLRHSGAKVLFVDYQFLEITHGALNILSKANAKLPILVLIPESHEVSPFNSSKLEYESLLATGRLDFEIKRPKDETYPISINYTSGTTSSPKGVFFNHRGAYLNSIATVMLSNLSEMPVCLWTIPMFHVNGWSLIWGGCARGATNINLRNVTAKGIFDNIAIHKVTHMGGAPTVLNTIVNALPSERKPLPSKVEVLTAGAAPPSQVLFKMEEMGFFVTHSYGLSETHGPATVCTWKPEWNALPRIEQAQIKARQGLHHIGMEEVDVRDPVTLKSVPADGKTMGEVMFRGNTVMSGYLNNMKATEEALAGGWFHSGDLAVKHPDGYIELKDRSKDIIISGGENISSIEVESTLFAHPAILEAAVVGRPDDHWGETPCAFVKLKDGYSATSAEIIKYCREKLPHYMAPRTVVFEDIPKTSTGKTQKFVLKAKAKAMGSLTKRIHSTL